MVDEAWWKCVYWGCINVSSGKPSVAVMVNPFILKVNESSPIHYLRSSQHVTALLYLLYIIVFHTRWMLCVAVVKPSSWMCICTAGKGYLCHTRVNHWQPSLMCARVWMQWPWMTWHINRPVGRDFLCISKYNPGADKVWERWINHQWLRIISVAVQG